MPEYSYKYLFGPVASRRLGKSLGVDLIPFKTCTYDCIYCQLGKTKIPVNEIKEYVDTAEVLSEFKRKIKEGLDADYITFSGSGEPTLSSKIGYLIRQFKKLTRIPVAVITNGSLFSKKEVRERLSRADLVIPSLDAGSEEVFKKINRPHDSVNFTEMVQGLIQFRKEFKGRIALEIFLVEGFNTTEEELARMKIISEQMAPDAIEINTVVRPPAYDKTKAVSFEKLIEIKKLFGEKAKVISDSKKHKKGNPEEARLGEVLSLLRRRPCTLEDISTGLNARPIEIIKCLEYLKHSGAVYESNVNGQKFFNWKE
jgi:wyosine [tRNA(Phe)-imidazoG37] synthetase (radical SAM superfamily)